MDHDALTALLKEWSGYRVERKSTKQHLRVVVDAGRHRAYLQAREGRAIRLEEPGRQAGRWPVGEDWFAALAAAEEYLQQRIARALRDEAEAKVEPGGVVIGTVMEVYVRERLDKVGPDHRRQVLRVFDIIHDAWPGGTLALVTSFDQRFVEWYVDFRSKPYSFSRGFQSLSASVKKRKTLQGRSRNGSLRELKDLSTVLQHAVSMRRIPYNPLARIRWHEYVRGDQHRPRRFEAAAPERMQLLLRQRDGAPSAVHRVRSLDGGRMLRMLIFLQSFYGRRANQPLGIRLADLAFDPDDPAAQEERVASLLTRARHPSWWARHWPRGAIYWRTSKPKNARVTPVGEKVAGELLHYREWHRAAYGWEPDQCLFPSPYDPTRPTVRPNFNRWMSQARAFAREDLAAEGKSEIEIEELLRGEPLHGHRGHYATMLRDLGYGAEPGERGLLSNHVAYIADWALVGGIRERVYEGLNPVVLQMTVDLRPAAEARARLLARGEGAKAAVEYDAPKPPPLPDGPRWPVAALAKRRRGNG
jgi:hypothetical protein